MKFCTRCGHRNPDNSAFCEACGNALRARPAAPAVVAATAAAVTPVPATARKMAGIGAAVLAALLATAVGIHFMLAPGAPTEAALAAAAQRYLTTHPEFSRERLCLRNFPYGQDAVFIAEADSRAKKWFEMLAEAGLYQAAEKRSSDGWYAQSRLVFRKTEAGKKAMQGNRLCFAEGLLVKRIENISAPAELNEKSVVQADVVLDLRNAADWTGSDTARELAPESFSGDWRHTWRWGLREGKWTVLDAHGAERAKRAEHDWRMQSEPAAKQATQPAASVGLLAKLKNLFSVASSNPLIGKWETSMMGLVMLQYEFTEDAMRSNGGEAIKVRYEMRDQQVVVYPEGQAIGLIVNVIDRDTIELNVGPAGMRFKRVPS